MDRYFQDAYLIRQNKFYKTKKQFRKPARLIRSVKGIYTRFKSFIDIQIASGRDLNFIASYNE